MSFEDTTLAPEVRARALLAAVKGRHDLKRLGAWVDVYGDDTLRLALVGEAARGGVDLPADEALTWPGKKLLRRAAAREVEAQVRTTPIRIDEAFTCAACHKEVPAHGRTARDHCPWCLRSLHVDDKVPGDRASKCGGRLEPYEIHIRGSGIDIRYRCARCRAEKVNQAVLDGDVPDSWDALVALSAGTLG